MSADLSLSHVASPRECDTRQKPRFATNRATERATTDATTPGKPASIRDLARDTLMRQQRDKVVAGLATELRDSINRCCDERRDDARNRAGLIAECLALSPEHQADALEHFRTEAARWQRANRGQAP